MSLLQAQGLTQHFPAGRDGWLGARLTVQAVTGVDLSIAPGEAFGLVGESGSGKSTLGRMLAGIEAPSAGQVLFQGRDLAGQGEAARKATARQLQMVFQDTLGSLNPRLTIGRQVREVLDIHGIGRPEGREAVAIAQLAETGLAADLYCRYPHELSGGQRQRVVIARALISEPALLVCDEPVSALDVSVQAQVVSLFQELRARRNLALLFISHDLRVVRQVCDQVAVLYLGGIVEQAPRAALFATPRHPYTRALVDAVPVADPSRRRNRIALQGEPPSPIAPPAGCRFHPRCPVAEPRCRNERPMLRDIGAGHRVACHLVNADLAGRA